MVVFDATALLLVLDPNARPPRDPETGATVGRAADRIDHLVRELTEAGEQVLIPTPALSEVLVHAGEATQDYLDILNGQACFRIAPFDQKAVVEAALAVRDALSRGNIRADAANPNPSKAKVKFDRQIVAIAKAEGAHTIYSDDADVIGYAKQAGLQAYRTVDLPLPPEPPQHRLPLDD